MKIFENVNLGKANLKNRIVMAPMTRSRALNNIPNDLMAKFYGQRAEAGLLITEGIAPSPNGLGYARIPGIFNEEQMLGWKKVTQAVYDKGGKIFAQLMHTGRVSHSENLPKGARVLAPSAIAVSGKMWTDANGEQSYPTPVEMTADDILQTINEYVKASELAIKAGFDGVELHAANGYLMEQFLNPLSNKRTDNYGGSAQNRMRFTIEVSKAVAQKIGADKTGIRVSPYGVFNDTGAFEGVDDFYTELAQKLNEIGMVYIHVVDHNSMGAPTVSADLKRRIRENFKGTYILSGGYDLDRAEHDLLEMKGDLVAFGRPFIANPDLVTKFKNKTPLVQPDPKTFYTPGAEGYIY